MGVVRTVIALVSPDRSRREPIPLVVDTGSLFTWLPADRAAALGIAPEGIQRFRAIDGRLIERRVADARIEWENIGAIVRVVLGEPGDVSVLGLTSLETLGLEVDPRSQSLRRSDSLLALKAA